MFTFQTATVIRPLTRDQTGQAITSSGDEVVIRQTDHGYVSRSRTNLRREPYLAARSEILGSMAISCGTTICYTPSTQAGCTYAGNWVTQQEWLDSLNKTESTRMQVDRLVTTQNRRLRTMVVYQPAVFTGTYRELKQLHPKNTDDPFADFADGRIVCSHQFYTVGQRGGLTRCLDPRPPR